MSQGGTKMPQGRSMNARRVLVAQSYFLGFDPKLQAAGQPVPPLGSLICASVLRERGFDVRFFDAMLAGSENDCAEALDREQPAALVIFEDNFNYLTKMCLERMREAAVRMIAMARARGVVVIVAGSDATDEPGFFLRAGASAVATGEGEFAVADWLESGGAAAPSIPGMVTAGTDGTLVMSGPRSPVTDLDSIPSPAWDLIDLGKYRRIWESRHQRFSLPLATSRGCPFHCNWCAKPIWGQRYNAMSPGRAAREVARLKELGATHVNVLDDIFGLRPGWLEEFGAALVHLEARLPFKCLSRADLLTDRTVDALARAGCETAWIGAESGSQKILDGMEKGTTVEGIRAARARLGAAGIKAAYFLQFGYPGENEEDVKATLALVDETLPDDIGISVSYPLPGTRFYARVKGEMGKSRHWRDSSDLAMLFSGRHTTAYYRILHAYAHARFRRARAWRSAEAGWPRRALRIARYEVARVFWSAALALAGRGRLTVRPLAPELSRENAATPAGALVRPSVS
jgi:anaerobic magnesium-protoporphyrin IX monomethyl ester cyclase